MCKRESLGRSAPFEPDPVGSHSPHPSRLDFAVNAALEAGHISLWMARELSDPNHKLDVGDWVVSALTDAPTVIGWIADSVTYKSGTVVLINWPNEHQSVWGLHEVRVPTLTEFLALPLP